MSISIYTGFKIDKIFSANELLEFSNEIIRPVILKSYKDKVKKISIERMVQILDIYNNYGFLNKKINKDIKLFISSQSFLNNKNLFNRLFSCSIKYYPLKNKTLFYLNNDNYLSDISNIKDIETYYYWDNVEKPEEIFNEEWINRKDDWEIALKYSYLKDNSFNVDVIKEKKHVLLPYFFKNFKNFIPTEETRLKWLNDFKEKGNYETKKIELIDITEETFFKNINDIFCNN